MATRTVNLTPSWSYAVEIYLAVLDNPDATQEGRNSAKDEIRRLAKSVDDMNSQ